MKRMSNNSSNTYIIKNKSIASLNEVYKLIIRGERYLMRIYQTGQDIYLSIYLLNMVLLCKNGISMKIMCMYCFGHNLKVRLVSLSMHIRVPVVASLKKNILRFAKSCRRNVFGVRVFVCSQQVELQSK